MICFGACVTTSAQDYAFNPVFMHGGKDVDMKRFSFAGGVPPGSYSVELYVNNVQIGRQQISFENIDTDRIEPCFVTSVLQLMNIDWTIVKQPVATDLAGVCQTISSVVDGASISFDASEQRLNVFIPQKFVVQNPRGYVPKEYWNSGVNGGFLNYVGNAFFSNGLVKHQSQYLSLSSGVNVGEWHFRNSSTVVKAAELPVQMQAIATYLERDIPDLGSKLVIGDSFTDGRFFDAVGMRGVTLASDELMEPSSLRGYAPVIRGTALSNAKVSISQNGYTIYETTVSPGSFEIKDLYPTGTSGNYLVTVTEADGHQTTAIVPFATVPLLMRKDGEHFSASLGTLRDPVVSAHPPVFTAAYQYGVTSSISLYSSLEASAGYGAMMMGAALNTHWGALGMDLASAISDVKKTTLKGTAVRATYSKGFEELGANLLIGAYRYASSGYLTLEQAVAYREMKIVNSSAEGNDSLLQRKNQIQFIFNQNLPNRYGSVFISGSTQNYWNHNNASSQFQFGYNNSLRQIRYNISASNVKSINSHQSAGKQIMVGLTIPLGRGVTSIGSNTIFSGGATYAQQTLSSSLGDANQFSYGLDATEGSQRNIFQANGQYRGPIGTLSASASQGQGYTQESIGVSGSLIAYSGGAILSGPVGDTFGIVEADGGVGTEIGSSPGLKVNTYGRAVVPYLTPYSFNTVLLNTEGMPADVEFTSTEERVAPHSGSIALLKFKRVQGQLVFLRAIDVSGNVMPFGAEVLDVDGQSLGTVGYGGKILFRSTAASGVLKVNHGLRGSCSLNYVIPTQVTKPATGFLPVVQGICVDIAAD
nr:fimbria/pilus outer membrane usher protein [Glaciimonas sp. PAMC28666]